MGLFGVCLLRETTVSEEYRLARRKTVLLTIAIITVITVFSYVAVVGLQLGIDEPVLGMPIVETDRIERLSPYHAPDWGEPGVFHNGIDLIISDDVTIVSPVKGVISSITERVNPYAGNVLFAITIAVNLAWEVKLVLEPGFLDSTNNSLQSEAIGAEEGQNVNTGEVLATLLHSERYPHLHYMLLNFGSDVCAYNYSSSAAKSTFENIADISNSTILLPHEQSNPMSGSAIAVPITIVGAEVLIGALVVRRMKE